jgi:ferredoxin-NADP reductase
LVVQDLIHHSPDIFELRVDRENFDFTPGQYVSIYATDNKISREYSIASGINDPYLGFLIKHLPEGIVTEYLMSLKPGDLVTVSQPKGEFRPGSQHSAGDFTFIATGTGIAPFLSYIKSYPDSPPRQFFYGVRYFKDAVGYETFNNCCKSYLTISRENIPRFHYGRLTSFAPKMIFGEAHHYYLCGLDAMIEDIRSYLLSHRVSLDNIHHEIFFYSK